MAATVEESTPPDMATAIVLLGSLGMVLQFYFLRVLGETLPLGGCSAFFFIFILLQDLQRVKSLFQMV